MSDLSSKLYQLKQEISRKLPAWLLGRPTNDTDAERRDAEIGDSARNLTLLIRDMKSRESSFVAARPWLRGDVFRTCQWITHVRHGRACINVCGPRFEMDNLEKEK
jgi:hypothetical protein